MPDKLGWKEKKWNLKQKCRIFLGYIESSYFLFTSHYALGQITLLHHALKLDNYITFNNINNTFFYY